MHVEGMASHNAKIMEHDPCESLSILVSRSTKGGITVGRVVDLVELWENLSRGR